MMYELLAGHFPCAVRAAGRPLAQTADAVESLVSVGALAKVELLAAPGGLAAATVANPAH